VHIPDGFLDAKVALTTGALAAAGLGVALRRARVSVPRRRVPLLGLAAAFVFAAQMVNFPVASGTSGHLVGAVLAAVLLGPSAAVIVISAVLIVQCLVFADGGLSALGANILNMGLLAGVGGWLVYRAIGRAWRGSTGRLLAASFAGWCGTVIAAIACTGELALSGTAAWPLALPAMAGVHMLIGLGEGMVTALVIAAIGRARPELLDGDPVAEAEGADRFVLAYAAVIALGLVLFASPLASRWPDGLERAAEALGFAGRATAPVVAAPIPEYAMPGVHVSAAATAIAGLVGAAAAFAVSWSLARSLTRPAGPPPAADGGRET
jgi:cobalt/nickel transport system permease protein